MYNNSDEPVLSQTRPEFEGHEDNNNTIDKPINMETGDTNDNENNFIEVTRKYRRYRTHINGLHVQGSSEVQKLNNLTNRLANEKGFIECKRYIYNKDLCFRVTFDNKEDALKACDLELFEGNEHKLNFQTNRGDEDTLERTIVVRDLPLDLDRNLLKVIIKDKFGEIESSTVRLAGPWYRADIILNSKEKIEENINM